MLLHLLAKIPHRHTVKLTFLVHSRKIRIFTVESKGGQKSSLFIFKSEKRPMKSPFSRKGIRHPLKFSWEQIFRSCLVILRIAHFVKNELLQRDSIWRNVKNKIHGKNFCQRTVRTSLGYRTIQYGRAFFRVFTEVITATFL